MPTDSFSHGTVCLNHDHSYISEKTMPLQHSFIHQGDCVVVKWMRDRTEEKGDPGREDKDNLLPTGLWWVILLTHLKNQVNEVNQLPFTCKQSL